MLDIMGVEANFIQDYEMRDNESGFLKRLGMTPPNILSNFYPKEQSTEYDKLGQFYTTKLPNGVNMYVINLFDLKNIIKDKFV